MPALAKWQEAFWDALPPGPYKCDGPGPEGKGCPVVREKHYVQPQLPRRRGEAASGKSYCGDCINLLNRAHAAERKAQLEAEARCEVPGCRRRGTFVVGTGRVLLCGRHKKRCEVAGYKAATSAGSLSFLYLFGPRPSDRETVLKWASS